jgi:Spy/CpxP family protein refolding chaperone
MQRNAATILFALSLCAALSGEAGPGPGGEDLFARYLFPPDTIMGHAQEIGLDDAQRTGIRNEVRRAQTKFLDLQFDLQTESEKMASLLQEKPVNEAKVLAQVDRILALEKEVKKTQVGLLVRIKNLLTPAQQAKLAEMRKGEGK